MNIWEALLFMFVYMLIATLLPALIFTLIAWIETLINREK